MLNFQSDTPRNSRQTPRKKRTSAPVGEILQYTPPQLRENAAGIYVEFYAYDPSLMRMRRKTIKLNRVKGTLRRRQYAREIIGRLNNELQHGWNPWIEKDTGTMYLFEEAADRYETHLERMYEGGYFRKDTYAGYKSYLKILRHYIEEECPIRYVYQFDRRFCTDFLDYVFIIRGNGAQTRNNYLHFLRLFSTFLVEKSYLNSKPTECITPISKRLYKKERTSIPLEKIGKMGAYLRHADPDFLLACYLLYYCFIRPVEMTRLRISDINLAEGTITIPADASKTVRGRLSPRHTRYCSTPSTGGFSTHRATASYSRKGCAPEGHRLTPRSSATTGRRCAVPCGSRKSGNSTRSKTPASRR